MKYIPFAFVLFFICNAKSQITADFQSVLNLDLTPIGKELENVGLTEEDKIKLLQKKYLTIAYNPSLIDDFTTIAYLRYNLYEDQMEFVKGENIYYLKKDFDRSIRFTQLNTHYKVYELNGELQFFLVEEKGKSSLLVKQSVRFVEPRKATTTYGKDKLADFKRRKDELYLAKSNTEVVSLPKKKKDFYKVFGDKSSDIKSYMKKNKLGTKKVKDLKKIIAYYNTL